ncbi:MAG TPA: hypothetical protein DCM08_12595 [Microscillaceae bacterium]|jgi:hypothetical protein|nr:hypothetical protein [Microscillaceae bacterium]
MASIAEKTLLWEKRRRNLTWMLAVALHVGLFYAMFFVRIDTHTNQTYLMQRGIDIRSQSNWDDAAIPIEAVTPADLAAVIPAESVFTPDFKQKLANLNPLPNTAPPLDSLVALKKDSLAADSLQKTTVSADSLMSNIEAFEAKQQEKFKQNPQDPNAIFVSLDLIYWDWESPPDIKDNSQESGIVAFDFVVDENGRVIDLTPVKSTITQGLLKFYEKQVYKLKFFWTNRSKTAQNTKGRILFKIRPGQDQ